jgi:hypothetical protein
MALVALAIFLITPIGPPKNGIFESIGGIEIFLVESENKYRGESAKEKKARKHPRT